MNLNDQVCDIELAKKLKELGVPQVSAYHYHDIGYTTLHSHNRDVCNGKGIAAFTVAELGALLPFEFTTFKTKFEEGAKDPDFEKDFVGYRCSDFKYASETPLYIFGKTEAEARAKTLIYLLENKKLNVNSLKV